MSDTIGSLIDKLITVDMKMWSNQENIFHIRKMTYDEFKSQYIDDSDGSEKLYEYFKKGCDLNLQRNQIIDEIDEKVIEIVKANAAGTELDNGNFVQRKHKTY
jgi:hypothetical protein